MVLVFNAPTTLFVQTTILTGMKMNAGDNHVTFEGEAIEVLNPSNEGWKGEPFGFVNGDVDTEDVFDRLLLLSKAIRFAKKAKNPVDFLFFIHGKGLWVYWREKPAAW